MPRLMRMPMVRSSERASSVTVGSKCLSIPFASSAWSTRSNNSPAGEKLNQKHDHGDHQQQVNQTAADMHRKTAQPEDHQDHDDQPKQIPHKNAPRPPRCHSYAMLRTED